MNELKLSNTTEVNGGKLINGGYSGHPGWPTSAIKADPKKQKKAKAAICVGANYVAGKVKNSYASSAASAVAGLFCGR